MYAIRSYYERAALIEKYEEKRAQLKAEGDYIGLQKLPKNSSKVRLHNRCKLTGRPKGYMRQFGISRINFREMASSGLIPGVITSYSIHYTKLYEVKLPVVPKRLKSKKVLVVLVQVASNHHCSVVVVAYLDLVLATTTSN